MEDVPGLNFITRLKPVTYNLNVHRQNKLLGIEDKKSSWQGQYDIEKLRMSGFLAQQVEEAARQAHYNFSGIVKPANSKDLYGLRYADFVVPLVKAVQEQQVIIENQSKTIEELKQEIAEIKRMLKK